MPTNNSSLGKFIPTIFGAGAIAVIVGGISKTAALQTVPNLATNLGSIAAGLVAAAMIIERAVEVLLGVPRAQFAQEKKSEVAAHESAAKIATTEAKLTEAADFQMKAIEAEASLALYKEETKRKAVALSFSLGAVLSVFGVRALAQFWTFPNTSNGWLIGGDIFFTACLLSAGGQGVHLLFTTMGDYVESVKPKS